MFGLFGTDITAKITVNGNPALDDYRKSVTSIDLPTFQPGDKVSGQVEIELIKGKPLAHQGIHLTLFGEYRTKAGEILSRFYERVQYMCPAGDLTQPLSQSFDFDNLKFPTCSYIGKAFDAIYGIELKVVRRLKDFIQKSEFLVFIFTDTTTNDPIHSEVGMSQVLHIEFIFAHEKFDCHDVIIGATFPILVKLRVIHMQRLILVLLKSLVAFKHTLPTFTLISISFCCVRQK
jgi:hypothetical protein